MSRVGQTHTCIRIYGVYTVISAGKLPYIRSNTVLTNPTHERRTEYISTVGHTVGHTVGLVRIINTY